MHTPRLLVIAASQRRGSFNLRLARVAAGLARQAGAEVTEFDLRALALPVYDGDLEADSGVPPAVAGLRDALAGCDAVLIATPEYNGFPTPLLINAFDWLSRLPAQAGAPGGLQATANKPVALLAASPGLLGGLRAMNTLRQYLQMAFAMIVVPQQFALSRAGEAFDDSGALVDPKATQAVQAAVAAVLRLGSALAPAKPA